MLEMRKGRYVLRVAADERDLRAAQRLRWLCFVGQRQTGGAAAADGVDADDLDAVCRHVLIEEAATGTLVGCFRVLQLAAGAQIGRSYSARHYDLSRLARYDRPMIEVGRFCVHPAHTDPEIVRIAWAGITALVDRERVGMLFGCSSFMGAEPAGYEDTFAMLRARHIAPMRWLPRVKAPDVFRFGRLLRRRKPDARRAVAAMPPLLRSYLLMGGWVSNHAVVDRQLDTLHVFTGLEIGAIPPARARLLRGLSGQPG